MGQDYKKGGRIEKVIEKFSPTQDILASLGKRWRDGSPTDIDNITVESLSRLSKRPYSQEALISELRTDESRFSIAFEYGENGGYLGKFTSNEQNKEAVWSPYYWSRNHDKVLDYLNKQSYPEFEKVGLLSNQIRERQGVPSELIMGDEKILEYGVRSFWGGMAIAALTIS